MLDNRNIFSKKIILIYGLGKSGIAAYKFLKKENELFLYDDRTNNNINKPINKKLINKSISL